MPFAEPVTALANNRRDRTEELPGAVDADRRPWTRAAPTT